MLLLYNIKREETLFRNHVPKMTVQPLGHGTGVNNYNSKHAFVLGIIATKTITDDRLLVQLDRWYNDIILVFSISPMLM